jgi:hypothetical protein
MNSFLFGMPDSSLNAVPMKLMEQCARSRTQIQAMEAKVMTGSPIRLDRRKLGGWAEFYVLAALGHSKRFQCGNQARKVFRVCR